MAISVDWITGEITVPRADMPVIQVSPEIRSLDTAQFWLDLKDLESSADGMPWPDTQTNFPSYAISGFTYVQAFLIIPPYFVTFEDGQYAVALQGTNNNILDIATQNQVRIASQNSAGNISQPKVDELYKLMGLDSTDPVVITPSGVDTDSGDIDINFTGDGISSTRMERQ
jgi:hypothetical protein